jgi:hypothetical protein
MPCKYALLAAFAGSLLLGCGGGGRGERPVPVGTQEPELDPQQPQVNSEDPPQAPETPRIGAEEPVINLQAPQIGGEGGASPDER